MARSPGVVAGLGRPETPEEAAARRAEASKKHRANQTVLNLVLALGASLAIVFVIVLVVVRPDQPPRAPVDYLAVAAQAQAGAGDTLAAPALPPGWTSNSATLAKGTDGITTWSIGFITPSSQFIGLRQGLSANSTWTANQLEKLPSTGSEPIGGVTWTIVDNRLASNSGNLAYALTATAGASSYVLYGTASDSEFRTVASAISADLATAGKLP